MPARSAALQGRATARIIRGITPPWNPVLNFAPVKILRIAIHILSGSLTVFALFPRLDRPERARKVEIWAAKLLAILRVEVVVKGAPDIAHRSGALLVANHVSWMDIYVLFSVVRTRFISKAEVRGWPVIGWLAEEAGTLFLTREKKSDAMRLNLMMASHLREGDCLTLFPEGTTSDGRALLPFFPSLFQPAVDAEAHVWPVRIRYLTPEGEHCPDAAYHGGTSLGESLLRIARLGSVRAEISFLPPIPSKGLRRRELAGAAEAAIRKEFGPASNGVDAAPGNAPGNTAHPPV
jgi:1-acyl-sn-glycerol-3-phosphate acyltransferase